MLDRNQQPILDALRHSETPGIVEPALSTFNGLRRNLDRAEVERAALIEACQKLAEWQQMIAGPNPHLEGIGFPNTLERALELNAAALAAARGETT